MTEQAIEQVAVPAVEAAAKALAPEAEALLADFKTHAESEATKLEAAVHQLVTEHHAGLLGWLQQHLGTAVDPTAAVPAPQP